MIARVRNLVGLLVSLTIAYGAIYLAYRFPNTETWGDDQVVVFGSSASYLFFRPAAYVDGNLTGMRFHLGPHREQ